MRAGSTPAVAAIPIKHSSNTSFFNTLKFCVVRRAVRENRTVFSNRHAVFCGSDEQKGFPCGLEGEIGFDSRCGGDFLIWFKCKLFLPAYP